MNPCLVRLMWNAPRSVVISPFVANGRTYQIKAPIGNGDPIPLRITVF